MGRGEATAAAEMNEDKRSGPVLEYHTSGNLTQDSSPLSFSWQGKSQLDVQPTACAIVIAEDYFQDEAQGSLSVRKTPNWLHRFLDRFEQERSLIFDTVGFLCLSMCMFACVCVCERGSG